MKRIDLLHNAKNRKDLADILGIKVSTLTYILYKIPEDEKYIEKIIPKKNGRERLISIPMEKLKMLQSKLAVLLTNCVGELDKNISWSSYGFRKSTKYSLHNHVKNHKGRRHVLTFDIKDFFPSINFGRIRGFFIKSKHFKLNHEVATTIAQISCFNNQLPQGSPCSPIISVLIGSILDARMVKLAKKNSCFYSRYADDLVLSTNKKEFPSSIACRQDYKSEQWILGSELLHEVERSGFNVNSSKTHYMHKSKRQLITGLVGNKKVNIKSEYYKLARSMVHNYIKTGRYYIPSVKRSDGKSLEVRPDRLNGILSYIYYTKVSFQPASSKKKNNNVGIGKLYKQFLWCSCFFRADKPLILTEGISDQLYLRYALRTLAASCPNLISMENDTTSYSITFFNRARKRNYVMGLKADGGVGGLYAFLNQYMEGYNDKKSILHKTINKVAPNHPVLIICDGDDAGTKFFKAAIKNKKNNESHHIDVSLFKFVHIKGNIYIAKLPDKKEIEDLFESETAKKLKKHKECFLSNKNEILNLLKKNSNWGEFKKIFDAVNDAISSYKGSIANPKEPFHSHNRS